MNTRGRQHRFKVMLAALAGVCWLAAWARPAGAWQDQENPGDANVQVLTRGPIHEAFAEPIVYDPKAGPVVDKEPPKAVPEVPPDQKPEGSNVQWIPGYWSWDDSRKDYIWVSGLWRDVPPDRHWVPGYWDKAQGGYQWVPGYWAPEDAQATQYLPAPPQSLEAGPSSPSPAANSTWAPGFWGWQDNQYVWRPGYWVPFQSDWVWVPAHYVWTPSGYVFVGGYWDRPLVDRGQLFAPVYFQQPLYSQPNYAYTPSVGLVGSALLTSLFVRPAYGSYYFGDYYAANNFQSGIYPWYSYHQSRYGYDPLYAHYAAVNTGKNPRWLDEMHSQYQYLREHPEFRPPHTYAETLAYQKRSSAYAGTKAQTPVLARPLGQIASTPSSPVKFERINQERRQAIARQSAELHQYRDQRVRQESQGSRVDSREFKPREVPQTRSPIVGTPRDRVQSLPAAPMIPRADASAAAKGAAGQPPKRFEPHPENLPPDRFRPNFRPQEQPKQQQPPRQPQEQPKQQQPPRQLQEQPKQQQPPRQPQEPPKQQQPPRPPQEPPKQQQPPRQPLEPPKLQQPPTRQPQEQPKQQQPRPKA